LPGRALKAEKQSGCLAGGILLSVYFSQIPDSPAEANSRLEGKKMTSVNKDLFNAKKIGLMIGIFKNTLYFVLQSTS
jgi:hypothetical protein